MIRKLTIPAILALICTTAYTQPAFSIATDLSLQHNFKKDQRYWAIGQTVNAHFHLSRKEGVYAWFTYYSNGKFTNHLVASAKSPATNPQQIPYINSGKMRLKHFSIGYRRYLTGAFDAEKKWSLYAYAGFGLLLGRIINTHSVAVDTSLYALPVLSGKANFKRLTIDPGIGLERYLGADLFLYGEARVWVPTTDYPSTYMFVNENAPWVAMLNLGLRILF